MKRAMTLCSAAAIVLFTASLFAQAKPDFSGTWTPDADKNPAAMGGGGGGRGGGRGGGGPMTIAQDATTLTITRSFGGNDMVSKYMLDGSPSKNTMNGRNGQTEQTSTAKWDGSTLVITTEGQNGNTVAKYSMDGADLKIENTRPGRNGGDPTTSATYYKKG